MVKDDAGTPVGVVIAAVVLAVMAFLGLLIAACSAYVMFGTNSALVPRIPSVRMAAGGLDALILALVILATFTVVGLFRLKVWARYSMTLLGLLEFLVFAVMAAGVLVARAKSGMATMPIPNDPGLTLGRIMLWLACFYAGLALIGVWWMIYFNTRHARRVFADAEPDVRLVGEASSDKSFLGLN